MRIIEKQREEFLSMLHDSRFLNDSWLAVCFFVPAEWLHELEIAGSRAEKLIQNGAEILSILENGYYSRIGWSSFFCMVKDDEKRVSAIIQEEMRLRSDGMEENRLWRFSVAAISDALPVEVFSDLEWRSHEEAQRKGYI